MNIEVIKRVELLETNELLVAIEGEGDPSYEFVYRAAAGVYWDRSMVGFKSTPLKKWTCAIWFAHIVNIAREEAGVDLILKPTVAWHRVPEIDRLEIERSAI